MNRVYNFSAGPSMLPESVLLRAAAEMLDYQGTGQSVMDGINRTTNLIVAGKNVVVAGYGKDTPGAISQRSFAHAIRAQWP